MPEPRGLSQSEKEITNTPQNTVENPDVAIEEREKLDLDFLKIQLTYAVGLHKKTIKGLDGKFKEIDFESAIISCTRISKEIGKAYYERRGYWGDISDKEEYEAVTKKILSDIHREYDKNPNSDEWMISVKNCIANNINALPEKTSSAQEVIESKNESGRVGMFFYIVKSYEEGLKGLGAEGLEEAGISPGENYIEVHFQLGGKKLSVSFGKESLNSLAKEIKEKHLEGAGAIIGNSWLLNKRLVTQRIGFKILENSEKQKVSQSGNGFWGQFIDESGKMREDKVKKLLETGEAEYAAKSGYIPMEDFLRLYGEEEAS